MANITRQDAINDMLAAINVRPVSSIDETGTWPSLTYGSSISGQAARVLDRVTKEVLATREWQNNTIKNYSVTTDGSNELTFTAIKAIWVAPKGVLEGRNIGLDFDTSGANPKAYDFNSGTSVFTTGTYYFEVRIDKFYPTLTPNIQSIIVGLAVQRFQQERVGSPQRNAFIEQRRAEAEPFNTANRPPKFQSNTPLNAPMAFGGQQQGQ